MLCSDVLMFYFHPYGSRDHLDPVALLRVLHQRLAKGGAIETSSLRGRSGSSHGWAAKNARSRCSASTAVGDTA